ncbi:hypothetical protein GAN79_26050, partial [Bacteroides thetaiotaomicron]
MSDVRQLTPAACILVTLPYRSATVWSATKVVLYCRKSKCFPLYPLGGGGGIDKVPLCKVIMGDERQGSLTLP